MKEYCIYLLLIYLFPKILLFVNIFWNPWKSCTFLKKSLHLKDLILQWFNEAVWKNITYTCEASLPIFRPFGIFSGKNAVQGATQATLYPVHQWGGLEMRHCCTNTACNYTVCNCTSPTIHCSVSGVRCTVNTSINVDWYDM